MIEIVKMNESHVSSVAELEKQNFSEPWPEIAVRSELTNKLALWLVAVEDGEVLGYVGSQTVLPVVGLSSSLGHYCLPKPIPLPSMKKEGFSTFLR